MVLITIDEIIRDKLTTLISDSSLRKNLLKKIDLKLNDLIAMARNHYSARSYLAECEGTTIISVKVSQVRASRGKSTGLSQSAKFCSRCGRSHAPRSCSAFSKTRNN